MATKSKKIGAIITLDGAAEFQKNAKNCAAAVSSLNADMKRIDATYTGQENSLAALNEKQETAQKIQQAYSKQTQALNDQLQYTKRKYEEMGEAVGSISVQYDKAKKKLEEMEGAEGSDAKAIKEQQEETERLLQTLQRQSKTYETTGYKIQGLETKIKTSEAAEIRATKATEDYSRYLKEAQDSADGTASSIDKFGKQVKDSADSTGSLGNGLSVAGVAIGNFMGSLGSQALNKFVDGLKDASQYVVQVGSGFEAATDKVAALSGANASDMAALEDKAKEIGSGANAAKASATDVAQAFSYMALAGWNTDQMLESIDGVLNLATSSQMDLASASDMVTDYLSAFGLEAKDAGKMVDEMAYAQANSNTSTQQLGEAFSNCAASMHSSGQSMTTTTSILEALANQGTKGSEAGTALSAVMRDITSKMEDGAIKIGKVSVKVKDSEGNFRNLNDILGDVESAVDGLGSADKSAALKTTFTARSLKAVNEVLTEGTDKIKGYAEELESSDGAAEKMSATMNGNLKGSVEGLKNATENLGTAIYDKIKTPLTDVANWATDAINGIVDTVEPQKNKIQEFVEGIQDARKEADAVINDAAKTTDNIADTQSQIENYKGVIDQLRSLGEQQELNEYDSYKLQNAMSGLDKLMPGFSQNFSNLKDILSMTNQEYEKLFSSNIEGFERQTITTQYNKLLKTKADIEIKYSAAKTASADAEKEYLEAQGKANEAADKLGEYNKKHQNYIYDVYGGLKQTPEYDKLKSNFDELSAKAEALKDTYIEASKATADMDDELDKADGTIKNFQQSNREMADSLGITFDAEGQIVSKTNEMSGTIEKTKSTASSGFDSVQKFFSGLAQSAIIAEHTISDAAISAMKSVDDFQTNMRATIDNAAGGSLSKSYFDDLLWDNDEVKQKQLDMDMNLHTTYTAMKEYTEGMKTLSERGLAQGLLDQLAQLGVDGVGYVQALVAASDSQFKEYNDMWKQISDYSADVTGEVGDTIETYAKTVMKGIPEGYAAWSNYGIQTVQGLFDSIQAAKQAISKDGTLDFSSAVKKNLMSQYDKKQSGSVIESGIAKAVGSGVNFLKAAAQSLAKERNHDIVIKNNLTLDGQTVAKSTNKINRRSRRMSGAQEGW